MKWVECVFRSVCQANCSSAQVKPVFGGIQFAKCYFGQRSILQVGVLDGHCLQSIPYPISEHFKLIELGQQVKVLANIGHIVVREADEIVDEQQVEVLIG